MSRRRQPRPRVLARVFVTVFLLTSCVFFLTFGQSERFWEVVVGLGALITSIGALGYLTHTTAQRWRRHRAQSKQHRFIGTVKEMYDLTPTEFEHYVAWLYEQQGFITTVTPPQKDGGIDIFLYKTVVDRKPWGVVQVKRYAKHNMVNREELDKFYGAYHDKAKNGILVTTSTFSDWTRERASEIGTILIDGETLANLAYKYGIPSYMKESL